MKKIERNQFFASVRQSLFNKRLTQGQVDGMEAILDQWEIFPRCSLGEADPRNLAYMLATTYHEVNRTMQPIKEYGGEAYFFRMYDIGGQRPSVAKMLGNLQPGDGVKFCGRGLVQLTGRRNYLHMTNLVTMPRWGIDLTVDPDKAMRLDVAVAIMFEGMLDASSGFGDFTGLALDDFFGPDRDDPVGARKIINGTDKAELIAGYHHKFLAAITSAI